MQSSVLAITALINNIEVIIFTGTVVELLEVIEKDIMILIIIIERSEHEPLRTHVRQIFFPWPRAYNVASPGRSCSSRLHSYWVTAKCLTRSTAASLERFALVHGGSRVPRASGCRGARNPALLDQRPFTALVLRLP